MFLLSTVRLALRGTWARLAQRSRRGTRMDTLEAKLLAVVAHEYGLSSDQLHKDVKLADHGDSLDWVSLMMALEDAFGIKISDEVGKTLITMGDLLAVVREGVPA
jgi:acyl carrier protein